MAKLTQEEINAKIETAKQKREPREKINNTQLLEDNPELRVLHIRPGDGIAAARFGMTLAYRQKNGGPVAEVATALCKRGDTFSRKVGTKTAIESFLSGHTVFLPLARVEQKDKENRKFIDYPAVDTLTAYFSI